MKRILVAFLAVSLFFSGCKAQKDEQSNELIAVQVGDANKINKKDNKDLTLSMRTAITLNPLTNEDASVDNILRIMYEPLVGINESYKPVSSIAESWYYASEGRELNLKIKHGLKWHDGSSITADDVIFSLNTLKQAGENAVYKPCIERVASFSKTDDYTVSVRFTEAFSGNIYAMSFPLISSAYYGSESVLTSSKNLVPLGNGAYAFDDYTAAKELRLKAVNNSFANRPSIQNIIVNITTDADTDVYTFSQRITDSVVADETVLGKFDLDGGAKKFSYANNYYDFLGFNFNNEIFNDKNVRKAVALAVPTESIIDGIYLSNAVAADTPLNPQSWLNSVTESSYSYDLTGARQCLENAGFKLGENEKVRSKAYSEGVKKLDFTILVNQENEERCQVAYKIAEELNGIGFDVKTEKVNFDDYISRLESGDFDMYMGGWELSIVPEFGFLFRTGGSGNYGGYSNAKTDELIDAMYSAVGEAAMRTAMTQLQMQICSEIPCVSIVFRKSALFVDERIAGNIVPLQFNSYNGIEGWYIE
ncbi:MAG: peptide ABC transporter substrate-binding protein [Lachnospiraceae bacterium]|nr:peptide ABC transporter substrate-binding protein [Lachnospiraceae bacterium]